MRYLSVACLLLVFGFVSPALAQEQPPSGGGGTGSGTTCPAYLLAEFNNNFFYQEINCQTGKLLSGAKRYFSKVKTGCNGTTGCQCTSSESPSTQTEYADPTSRIFVPFGGGASSHLGPAKQLVQAGTKKFVIISMRLKGKATTSGASDNELDVIVQFGQEVDPSTTIPSGNTGATLSGNTLTFGGQNFTVTTKLDVQNQNQSPPM